ncbi:hypothetical protein [Paenibacillus spongiae]|uniref:Uncharacterized protein n=1 Tax=Paenibacillus spongiae TaxID=2909671 RepID=A0ABY5SBC0_9BACL|nr:hypothetical protein [Paenibacillus spongiae]UVI31217.1 hypothetical protein L1F29_05065 [Paenibacillus spongiae]
MVNTKPVFPKTPVASWATLNSANTGKDGSGTVATIFTAGADGARVDAIKVRALGANVATVLRIFINNGLVNSTPANNILFHEVTCPVTTANEAAAQNDTWLNFNGIDLPQLVLPPGYKINVTIGTAVSAGLAVSAIGGSYTG